MQQLEVMLPKREGHFTDPVKLLEYGLLGHLLLVEKEVTGEFIDLNLWIRAQDADNVTSLSIHGKRSERRSFRYRLNR